MAGALVEAGDEVSGGASGPDSGPRHQLEQRHAQQPGVGAQHVSRHRQQHADGMTPDTTDFRPILSKIKESGAEALLLNCYSQEGALIINQAHELGMGDVAMIGDGVFMDDAFFDVVGENAEGLYAITGEGAVAGRTDAGP